MLLRKGATIADRAGAALGNLQRSASAMGILRARIESRMKDGGSGDGNDLAKVLQLVKDAELLLKEMSGKAESARFLEDFVRIVGGTAESIGQVKDDVSELVPMAEAALDQMRDVVTSVSVVLSSPAMKDEIDPVILEQVSAATLPAAAPAPTPSPVGSNLKKVEENEERIEVPA